MVWIVIGSPAEICKTAPARMKLVGTFRLSCDIWSSDNFFLPRAVCEVVTVDGSSIFEVTVGK